MNNIDIDELKDSLLRGISDGLDKQRIKKCNHIFKPACDGTGDLKCVKCGARAMQAVMTTGLKVESYCIDEYHEKIKTRGDI